MNDQGDVTGSGPPGPAGETADRPGDVTPPVGVANAYDAMQLTALAITKAGSTEGPKLREGLLNIDSYQGLIKNYTKPFTDENHDALNENDYVMVRYNGDQIEPVSG